MYPVKLALTKNPKVPLPVAMKFLAQLRESEVKRAGEEQERALGRAAAGAEDDRQEERAEEGGEVGLGQATAGSSVPGSGSSPIDSSVAGTGSSGAAPCSARSCPATATAFRACSRARSSPLSRP